MHVVSYLNSKDIMIQVWHICASIYCGQFSGRLSCQSVIAFVRARSFLLSIFFKIYFALKMSKFIVFSLFVLVCICTFSNASFQARILQPRMSEIIHKCHHTASELTLKVCMKVIYYPIF